MWWIMVCPSKYILWIYWTLIHIQIYTTEIYTSAEEKKSFDLYFLEARTSSSIFEKYRKWDNKILCSVCGSKSKSILQQ